MAAVLVESAAQLRRCQPPSLALPSLEVRAKRAVLAAVHPRKARADPLASESPLDAQLGRYHTRAGHRRAVAPMKLPGRVRGLRQGLPPPRQTTVQVGHAQAVAWFGPRRPSRT